MFVVGSHGYDYGYDYACQEGVLGVWEVQEQVAAVDISNQQGEKKCSEKYPKAALS